MEAPRRMVSESLAQLHPHGTFGNASQRRIVNKTPRLAIAGPESRYCLWRLPLRYVLALLALAGIVVSVLALRVHYSTDSAPCSINEKWDCGIVNHSSYAVISGVPVAAIGIAGYLVILVLAWMRRRGLLLLATMIGMSFALYLTHIEAKVLGVWCVYCVTSQAIIAALLLLSIGWLVWHTLRHSAA
jgi:vitamin-K-epoxide reductase (warfarin-sensitive)